MNLGYISYSQYSAYKRCPRSWYLTKVKQAEEKQTWYLPVGTAFHEMIETFIKSPEELTSAESYFYPLVARQMAIEPDTSKWLSAGSLKDPIVEAKALQQLKDCFEAAQDLLSAIDVWEVEYEATSSLPGLDVPVKAYVDIIGEHKKHGPIIGDWKTGKSKPKDAFQLETYSALMLERGYGRVGSMVTSWSGLWLMPNPDRTTKNPRVIDLSDATPEIVGLKYQEVYERMLDKLYPYNAGYDCKMCFHQDNCVINAGPTDRAKYYDRAHEDGYPF